MGGSLETRWSENPTAGQRRFDCEGFSYTELIGEEPNETEFSLRWHDILSDLTERGIS
jgi:hypothetical protein